MILWIALGALAMFVIFWVAVILVALICRPSPGAAIPPSLPSHGTGRAPTLDASGTPYDD